MNEGIIVDFEDFIVNKIKEDDKLKGRFNGVFSNQNNNSFINLSTPYVIIEIVGIKLIQVLPNDFQTCYRYEINYKATLMDAKLSKNQLIESTLIFIEFIKKLKTKKSDKFNFLLAKSVSGDFNLSDKEQIFNTIVNFTIIIENKIIL